MRSRFGRSAVIVAVAVAAPLARGADANDAERAVLAEAPRHVTRVPRPGGSGPVRRAPRHVALLIGIAAYENFPESGGEPGKTRLRAPVASDLPRMRKSLERWGFNVAADVRVLADSMATKAGIEAGLRWLAERASDTSDVVVVYYSGHGSWARDADGDEARLDPQDDRDEALVPWDASNVHDPKSLVLDDHLRVALARLATANVTVIIDACFSGTITRGESRVRARGPVGAGGSASGPSIERAVPRHTLITAARSEQLAAEARFSTAAGDRDFGVLTYFLTEALDAADSAARYDEVMRRVREGVRSLGPHIPAQDPQLEGDRNALLFRVRRALTPRPFAIASGQERSRVVLDVGAVHGARAGAVYDVFAPDEIAFRGTAPFGQLVIDTVKWEHSVARSLATPGRRVPSGARAVLARVPPGARTVDHVRVRVHPSASLARAAIASIPFVSVVDSAPDALVTSRNGAFQVSVDGTRLPPLTDQPERWRMRVVGRDTGFVGTAAALCGPLRRVLAIRSLHLLNNPAPPYLPVDLRLTTGNALPRDGDARRAADTVHVGRDYTLYARVRAPETSVLYLTVAVAGYVSDPAVLYPPMRGTNQPFPLNQWVPIRSGIRVGHPTGRETLKVVVDSRQFDLHSLIVDRPACDESERGVRRAGISGPWRPEPKPVTGWAAAERTVVIRDRPR